MADLEIYFLVGRIDKYQIIFLGTADVICLNFGKSLLTYSGSGSLSNQAFLLTRPVGFIIEFWKFLKRKHCFGTPDSNINWYIYLISPKHSITNYIVRFRRLHFGCVYSSLTSNQKFTFRRLISLWKWLEIHGIHCISINFKVPGIKIGI